MKQGRYEKKRKRRPVFPWLLVLVLAASCIGGVSAKYTRQREQDLLVQAKLFYFTSDLLKENGAEYTLNPGTETITIRLNNFADANRVSEVDIQYRVFVNDAPLDNTAVLAAGSANSVDISFPVEEGRIYEVRAEGAAGYTKTLTATFAVGQPAAGFYKHLSSTDYYVLLTVWTEDISGDVTVTFPAGLIPDDTNPELAGIGNYAGGTYGSGTTARHSFGQYSSRTYRFFKENPGTGFGVDDFTVTMGEKTAVAGTP